MRLLGGEEERRELIMTRKSVASSPDLACTAENLAGIAVIHGQ